MSCLTKMRCSWFPLVGSTAYRVTDDAAEGQGNTDAGG